MAGFVYNYPDAIQLALELAVDPETGEIVDEKALQLFKDLSMERDEKVAGLAFLEKDLEEQETQIRKVAREYLDKAGRIAERRRKIKGFIGDQLGGEKLKRPDMSIHYQTSKFVDVVDETAIPDSYFKVERTLRKSDILADLRKGKTVEGVRMGETKSVVIKTV